MSGNNRFSAFFSSLYHVVQESVGCTELQLLEVAIGLNAIFQIFGEK